ncbi:MAG: RHS repeat-associated core domain-containing protein [Gemmatimonadetes bacterium]|nr:RHS repeat-associated core domain-containing protein [Gemmatimonadota bacterium]
MIGRIAYANGTVREVFFVTDGQGRQLSLGEPNGTFANAPWADSFDDYKQYRWAGAATKAFSFAAERQSNANQPEISLFRNRAYDSRSGRWLQEDPIGIAGGINLYQFNGNNPVTYTDPFGLCPKDGVEAVLCNALEATSTALSADGKKLLTDSRFDK